LTGLARRSVQRASSGPIAIVRDGYLFFFGFFVREFLTAVKGPWNYTAGIRISPGSVKLVQALYQCRNLDKILFKIILKKN